MCVIIGSDKTEITAYLESGLAFYYLIPKSADAFLFLIVVDFDWECILFGGALFESPDSVLLKLYCVFCVKSAF